MVAILKLELIMHIELFAYREDDDSGGRDCVATPTLLIKMG